MPIRMGILCEKCGTVYFIASAPKSRIQFGDGFIVVRAMRKAQPKCVTIILTGYPAFDSAVQAIRDDVDDYFVKPANIDAQVRAIEWKLAPASEKNA